MNVLAQEHKVMVLGLNRVTPERRERESGNTHRDRNASDGKQTETCGYTLSLFFTCLEWFVFNV